MISNKPGMVFHAPYALVENAASASRIRPVKMRQAFKDLGYEVFDLTGGVQERRQKIRQLKRKILAGWRPEFCYSEGATIPNMASTPKKWDCSLTLEPRIFALMYRYGIPTGTFYRDIYWAKSAQSLGGTSLAARAMIPLYRFDLAVYRYYGVHLFVPSLQMSEEIPGQMVSISALPPGCDLVDTQTPDIFSLLYVGGLSVHYSLTALAQATFKAQVPFTLCTRKKEWEASKHLFSADVLNHLKIMHAKTNELSEVYDQTSVGVLVIEPNAYRNFAVPFKLYEYIGHGKPILVSSGTHAAQIVSTLGVGWVVENDTAKIQDLLQYLRANPQEVEQVAKRVREVRNQESWQARAAQAARVLKNKRAARS